MKRALAASSSGGTCAIRAMRATIGGLTSTRPNSSARFVRPGTRSSIRWTADSPPVSIITCVVAAAT